MSEQQLREAFSLMKEGKKQEAITIVREVLKANGKDERAWWMMAHLVDDEEKKRQIAQRVLLLNSEHAGAMKLLDKKPTSKPAAKSKKKRSEYDWSKLEKRQQDGYDGGSKATDLVLAGATSRFGRRILFRIIGAIIFFVGAPVFYFIWDNLPTGKLQGHHRKKSSSQFIPHCLMAT